MKRKNEKCSQLKRNKKFRDLKSEMKGDDVSYANLQIDRELK